MGKRKPPIYPRRCHCGKLYSANQTEARKLYKQIARQHGHKDPVRYYQCRYGAWHYTRDLKREGRKNTTTK